MQKCKVCGGSDFLKEAGFFFCQTCQTQDEDVREEVLELHADQSTRLRRKRIRPLRLEGSGEEVGWTSWELYNFVLIGLTNELIKLGVTTDIKLTILQLWATYLNKIEVAFFSTRQKCVPKLARRYYKRDAAIIYGKVQSQKRVRKRKRTGSSTSASLISGFQSEGSSMRDLSKNKNLLATAEYDKFMQSQESSEGDALSTLSQSFCSSQSSSGKSTTAKKIRFSSHAREEANKIKRLSKNVPRKKRVKYRQKHISTQYKTGPYIVTPMKLWAIVYLALRIHNEPIHLGDMLRYGREGHLSYYKLDHLLPSEISLTKSEVNLLSQNIEITHKGMRRIIASMAKLIGVWDIICPDFLPLVRRYCQELGLPRGIQLYTERLITLSPPRMTFNSKTPCIPNYEGRAMAYIIVVLKTLFALDGITEYEISRVADKLNSIHTNLKIIMQQLGEGECKCRENGTPCIIVHGGAGNFSDSIDIEKMVACKKAAANGYKKLMSGENSVEAVEAALWWLECDEFFNCSYGSALNELGKVQMDASIMDGSTLKCGSIAAVSDIEHPITLAIYAMKHFPNSIFVGEGAKQLAKYANLNWISEGNMVAPMAVIAHTLEETGKYDVDCDLENLQYAEAMTKSFGTVGCVAFDGYNIVAGTTTGGLNRKLVGRVGDSAVLGCGTYANSNAGCSLTGHGESIIKLGLSRAIVEDVERSLTSQESLKKHLSFMFDKFGRTAGGIALQSNGCWGMYFTSDKMPYAVIEDGNITFGVTLDEKRTEAYYDLDENNTCECSARFGPAERRLVDYKLFSFREWQSFIECRKTILVHSHFPTKLKYYPKTHGIDGLYIKFLEFINSKSDREEPEITNRKLYLPEELIGALKKHLCSYNDKIESSREIDFFPPSLTPLHSYIQQLIDHPLHELPTVVQSDFFLTKVGYMTKPHVLMESAIHCSTDLEIVDSNLHFVEKIVFPFERHRMPTVEELKEPVEVENYVEDDNVDRIESLCDYMHRKLACNMQLNSRKRELYDRVTNSSKIPDDAKPQCGFSFNDVLPNGRLAIPTDNKSVPKGDAADYANINGNEALLRSTFCDKYNLSLSCTEKEAIRRPGLMKSLYFKKNARVQLIRNSKGQFVKGTNVPIQLEESFTEDNSFIEVNESFIGNSTKLDVEQKESKDHKAILTEEILPQEFIDVNAIDIGDLDEDISFMHLDLDSINLTDFSLFCENNEEIIPMKTEEENMSNVKMKFFRPFKDYWMYHCIFSRVKPKNFEIFEKSLPRSFRWLLSECAHIVEMTTEDLYEEVCLIENYHSQIFKSPETANAPAPTLNAKSAQRSNIILRKW